MNINDAFPSKYIKASDLKDQPVTLTVTRVVKEPMVDGKVLPVVYFQGTAKGLVLNKTNGLSIARLYGPETASWAGKSIQLYPAMTEYQGQATSCVRVQAANTPPPIAEVAFPADGPNINDELSDAADADLDIPF